MAFIYAIRNILNGKMYIGKTEHANPEKRYKRHLTDAHKKRCKERALYRAINKYGAENFEFQVLEEVSTENVNQKEQHYIALYNTYHNGYNETIGGEGIPYVHEKNRSFIKKDTASVKSPKLSITIKNPSHVSLKNIISQFDASIATNLSCKLTLPQTKQSKYSIQLRKQKKRFPQGNT